MKPAKLTLAFALVTLLAPRYVFAASPIVVDQPSARFPDTAVGNGNVLTLTYSNGSNASQTITTVTMIGASPGDYSVMPLGTLPLTLPPGGTFKCAVGFNPTKIGLRSATVSLAVPGQQNCDSAVAGQATAATVSGSPSPLMFGGTALGVPVKKSVNFTNATMNQLTITGFSVTTNGAEFAAVSQFNFPAVVPGGATLPVDVTFTPQASGIRYGIVSLTVQGVMNPANVIVIGSSGDPQVNLGNNGVLFGNTHVGSASSPQMLGVGNIGYTDLHVLQVVIGGVNPGDFSVQLPNLPATAAPGASVMYGMVFKPMAAGPRNATVTVVTDDPNNGTVTFVVGGSGVAFMQTITPPPGTPLDFGQVKTGASSMVQSVTVTNSSQAPLTVSKVFLSGLSAAAFALVQPPVGAVEIKAGATASFPLTFKPNAGGLATALLSLVLDDPNTPVLTAALKGVGTAGAVTVSPLSVDFGSIPLGKTTQPKTITVTNSGSAPLSIVSVVPTGPDASAFVSPDAPSMPTMLDPNMSLSFSVVFTPALHAVANAAFVITSDDPLAPITNVALKGTGTQPRLTVSPMSLDFGVTVAGIATEAQNVSITNSGDDLITIDAVQVNGPAAASFRVEGFAGQTQIRPGEQIVVSVRFTPASAGALTATLQITPGAMALAPVAVGLKGNSVTTAVSITPSTNDFGLVDIGSSSDPVMFTVTNTSGGSLLLAPITSTNAAFVLDTSDTVLNLAPGAKTTFSAVFTPSIDQMEMGLATLSLVTAPKTVIAKVSFTGEGSARSTGGGPNKESCSLAGRRGRGSLASTALLVGAAALLLVTRRRRRRSA